MEVRGGRVGSGWGLVVVVLPGSCWELDGGAGGGLAVASRQSVGVGELIMVKSELVCIYIFRLAWKGNREKGGAIQ